MQITIAFRHLDSSPFIKNHLEEKLEKLPRFFSKDPIKVHAVITKDSSHFQFEIVATAESTSFTATGEGEDLYIVIDETCHRLEEQCRRHKDKFKDHKGPRHMSFNALSDEA